MVEDIIDIIKAEMMVENLDAIDKEFIAEIVERASFDSENIDAIVEQIIQHPFVIKTFEGDYMIL